MLKPDKENLTCKVCGREFKAFKTLSSHINRDHKELGAKEYKPSQGYYNRYYKKPGEGFCPICNKPTRFISLSEGYQVHCSSICVNKDTSVRDKIRKTNIRRYGTENPAQSKIVKDKIAKTFNERYNGNPSRCESVKQKKRDTCRANLGVDYPMQSEAVREKSISTVREHYCVDNISQAEEIKRSKTNTTKLHYGVDNPFQSEVIKSKIGEDLLSSYGINNVSQLDEIKQKKDSSWYHCACSSLELELAGRQL